MKKYKIILVISILSALVGCAAPGPIFEPLAQKEESAVLYIYRPSKFAGGGTYPHIYIDGKEKFPLRNGGYLSFYLSPGEYTIESKGKDWKWDLPDSSVKVTLEKGEIYYIKLDYDSDIGFTDTGKQKSQSAWQGSAWVVNYGAGFHPVDPDIGSSEIQSLKLSY